MCSSDLGWRHGLAFRATLRQVRAQHDPSRIWRQDTRRSRMRVIVAAVGRAKAGRDGAAPEAVLFENYARRASFDVTLAEVEERRQLPPAQRMAREGELLLSRVPAQATVVALDRLGKALSSEELAARLGRWRDSGVADVALDRKSTRLNSSHSQQSRMPSSA